MSASTAPLRVLIAKPGLDGHDVGAKIVCRALMEAGMEVIYTGLRRSPDAIAAAAAQEDVDVVGLSTLSGAHIPLTRRVIEALEKSGASGPLLIVGGNIPSRDHESLRQLGVSGIFPTGTALDEIVDFVSREARR